MKITKSNLKQIIHEMIEEIKERSSEVEASVNTVPERGADPLVSWYIGYTRDFNDTGDPEIQELAQMMVNMLGGKMDSYINSFIKFPEDLETLRNKIKNLSDEEFKKQALSDLEARLKAVRNKVKQPIGESKMKITKSKLKQLIKEELETIVNEQEDKPEEEFMLAYKSQGPDEFDFYQRNPEYMRPDQYALRRGPAKTDYDNQRREIEYDVVKQRQKQYGKYDPGFKKVGNDFQGRVNSPMLARLKNDLKAAGFEELASILKWTDGKAVDMLFYGEEYKGEGAARKPRPKGRADKEALDKMLTRLKGLYFPDASQIYPPGAARD